LKLYVCQGDDGGPPFHPCHQVQEALRNAGIEYDKIIAAKGNPIPFLRGPRPELRRITATEKFLAMMLADGAVLVHDQILAWIGRH
jgi:hypothetical protein